MKSDFDRHAMELREAIKSKLEVDLLQLALTVSLKCHRMMRNDTRPMSM